jgi:CHAT domain-containing protein/tetratricopeptide (TPR) repeat protein
MNSFDRLRRRLSGWRTRATLGKLNRVTIQLGAQGRFEEYLDHCRRALDLARSYYGEDSTRLELWYFKAAIPNKALGRYDEAEECYRRALEITRAANGDSHPHEVGCLVPLAQVALLKGDYSSAASTFQRALTICRAAPEDVEEDEVVRCLCGLARVRVEEESFAEAESLIREARERVRAARSTWFDLSAIFFSKELLNLAIGYAAKGQPVAAESLWQEVLDLPTDSMEGVAQQLLIITRIHLGRGDYASAEPPCRAAIETFRALRIPDPNYAACLDILANLSNQKGDHRSAETLYKEALQIFRAIHLEDDPRAAGVLAQLSMTYCMQGDFAAAEPLLRKASEIYRSHRGEDPLLYAQRLGELAEVYSGVKDYNSAEKCNRESLEILETTLDQLHPDVTRRIYQLGALYRQVGNYASAEPLLRRALEAHRNDAGRDDLDYACALDDLAALYRQMGDYESAIPMLHEAIEVFGRARNAGTPDAAHNLAVCLTNLAHLHKDLGDADAAEPLYRELLEINRSEQPLNPREEANALDNLAGVYMYRGELEAAEPLIRQALEIYRQVRGEGEFHYALCLANLATVLDRRGDLASAEPLFREALAVLRAFSGEDHPDVAHVLLNLACLLARRGDAKGAVRLLEEVNAIDDRMIGQVSSIGSERQRIGYLHKVLGHSYVFLSLVLQHLNDASSAVNSALDLALRRKAISAEATAAQREAILGGKYPALEPKLRELAALRIQIARKTLAGPGPEGLEAHLRGLGQCVAQRERLEAELARQIPEMNLERKLRASDRRAVALNLPAGVVLIEFVWLPIVDFQAMEALGESGWNTPRYVAFVLPGGAPDEVRMIDLGEAEPIDRLIAEFRAGIISEAAAEEDRDVVKRLKEATRSIQGGAGAELRAALFDRLAPALGNRARLMIAPDGDLTRLPFEVLPTEDGRRLIDGYQISYLSCGRDVLRLGEAHVGQPSAPLVVADPDFDLLSATIPSAPPRPDDRVEALRLGQGEETLTTEHPLLARAPAGCRPAHQSRDLDRDRSAYCFHRLPGTRAEGEQVANRLGVAPWLDVAALEGRLKAACRSPRILHVATHGFFLPDQQRDLNREGRGLGFDVGGFSSEENGPVRLSGPMMENPMLRSGLALAGANTWLKAGTLPEEAEDGLLTAEDVTGLDLLATELVVLSACETGLGQAHVGEGVFGLRRAFVLAGAKTLVMSLWKVPDEPTCELMEDFYRRLLAGEGRAEALRQAQLALQAKYPDPFYWGAFICQGDPGPLSTLGHRPCSAAEVFG